MATQGQKVHRRMAEKSVRVQIGAKGLDLSQPAVWDWSSPHALITGVTGSGKSWAARLIVEDVFNEVTVFIADGKGGPDYMNLRCDELALGSEECVDLMERVADVVHQRMETLRQGNRANFVGESILMVVDEAAAIQIRQQGDTAKEAKDRGERFAASLATVALLGRSAEVHLLVLLQRPDASFFLSGGVRDQFTFRVALGYMSPDGYKMMMDDTHLKSPTAEQKGHGWVTGAEGTAGRPEFLIVGAQPRVLSDRRRSWRKNLFRDRGVG